MAGTTRGGSGRGRERFLSLWHGPLLRAEELFDTIKELRYDEGLASEGEVLLASADRVIAKKQKMIRKTAELKEEIPT